MDLEEYLKQKYGDFYNQISYFLDNKDCVIFGGFVKSILINCIWNKELDVLSYDYKNTLKNFIKIFPPDFIQDIEVHTVLSYGEYKIDICSIFETNDFSFNSLGLISENIVVIPNIFTENIHELIYQFDKKIGIGSRCCFDSDRKLKYKDWKIIY